MKNKQIVILVCLLIIIILIIVYLLINANRGDNTMSKERTGWTEDIPREYLTEADHQGHIERIEYDTIDYTNSEEITKVANVYLPYGYNENDTKTKYNIFYLMHGWTDTADGFFSTSNIINILDHMIENKDINPLIVVTPTFDADNQSGQSFGRSVEQLEPFYLDFENALMPYVESHYNTYANSTSKEDLMASRHHRAFGGFSLGGVTTWYMFAHSLDYIEYFLPMSGDYWGIEMYGGLYAPKETVDALEEIVNENKDKDFFIYAALGTNDARYDQVNNQMVEMLQRDVFDEKHFVYYQVKNGYHDYNAADEDMYNGLQEFFK